MSAGSGSGTRSLDPVQSISMEESSTTLKALFDKAISTGEHEDRKALIDAWKLPPRVTDRWKDARTLSSCSPDSPRKPLTRGLRKGASLIAAIRLQGRLNQNFLNGISAPVTMQSFFVVTQPF